VYRHKRTIAASAGSQLRNQAPNQTCLQRRAGVRARGVNRLANQVVNMESGISRVEFLLIYVGIIGRAGLLIL